MEGMVKRALIQRVWETDAGRGAFLIIYGYSLWEYKIKQKKVLHGSGWVGTGSGDEKVALTPLYSRKLWSCVGSWLENLSLSWNNGDFIGGQQTQGTEWIWLLFKCQPAWVISALLGKREWQKDRQTGLPVWDLQGEEDAEGQVEENVVLGWSVASAHGAGWRGWR